MIRNPNSTAVIHNSGISKRARSVGVAIFRFVSRDVDIRVGMLFRIDSLLRVAP
jgi:hypothetical protein